MLYRPPSALHSARERSRIDNPRPTRAFSQYLENAFCSKVLIDLTCVKRAVSEAIEKATECIYIEDWWLSPELFLRRPAYYNQEWRLDQVLKRKAEAGVKIFVIVYREVEVSNSTNILVQILTVVLFRLLLLVTQHTPSMPYKLYAQREHQDMEILSSCDIQITMFLRMLQI